MMDSDRLNAELRSAAMRPWALAESHAGLVASMISEAMLGRASRGSVEKLAGSRRTLAVSSSGARVTRLGGGQAVTAVMSISGVLLYDYDYPPYITSSRRIAMEMDQLAADNTVSRVILDINSPGGVTTGIEEAAAAIFAARKFKRVSAIANPMADSAAYWLGSQANDFSVILSGEAGSVGVYMLHIDQSQALEQMGLRATFIKAGRLKTIGNSLEPLSDEAQEIFQRDVDTVYARFLSDVARGRGVSVSTVRSGFGEGRSVMAREALSLGMVDKIATPEQAFAASSGGHSGGTARRGATTERERQAEARARRIRILSA